MVESDWAKWVQGAKTERTYKTMTKQIQPKEDSVKKLKSMLEKIEITDNIPGLTDQSKEEQIVKHAFKAVDEYIEKDMQSSPSQEWRKELVKIKREIQLCGERSYDAGVDKRPDLQEVFLEATWGLVEEKILNFLASQKEEMIKRVEGLARYSRSYTDYEADITEAKETVDLDAVLEELRGV